jgi:hypothetical protein
VAFRGTLRFAPDAVLQHLIDSPSRRYEVQAWHDLETVVKLAYSVRHLCWPSSDDPAKLLLFWRQQINTSCWTDVVADARRCNYLGVKVKLMSYFPTDS